MKSTGTGKGQEGIGRGGLLGGLLMSLVVTGALLSLGGASKIQKSSAPIATAAGSAERISVAVPESSVAQADRDVLDLQLD